MKRCSATLKSAQLCAQYRPRGFESNAVRYIATYPRRRLLADLTGRGPDEVLATYPRYGELKDACADAVIAELEPIRRRHDELLADPAQLRLVLRRGAERASSVAEPVLRRAAVAIGVAG